MLKQMTIAFSLSGGVPTLSWVRVLGPILWFPSQHGLYMCIYTALFATYGLDVLILVKSEIAI